jgi:hypothetical protein
LETNPMLKFVVQPTFKRDDRDMGVNRDVRKYAGIKRWRPIEFPAESQMAPTPLETLPGSTSPTNKRYLYPNVVPPSTAELREVAGLDVAQATGLKILAGDTPSLPKEPQGGELNSSLHDGYFERKAQPKSSFLFTKDSAQAIAPPGSPSFHSNAERPGNRLHEAKVQPTTPLAETSTEALKAELIRRQEAVPIVTTSVKQIIATRRRKPRRFKASIPIKLPPSCSCCTTSHSGTHSSSSSLLPEFYPEPLSIERSNQIVDSLSKLVDAQLFTSSTLYSAKLPDYVRSSSSMSQNPDYSQQEESYSAPTGPPASLILQYAESPVKGAKDLATTFTSVPKVSKRAEFVRKQDYY